MEVILETFTLTINEPSSLFDNGRPNFDQRYLMTPATVSNSGSVSTWGISPTLPAGLTFNNGVLSGTPTVNFTQTEFTIYANNTGGSTTTTFDITINEPLANVVSNR